MTREGMGTEIEDVVPNTFIIMSVTYSQDIQQTSKLKE